MPELHLVLGGAASGKSALALARARALGGDRVTFVATARPGDPELDERIAAHRRQRPAAWRTVDAGPDLAAAVASALPDAVLLLDSLTLWVAAVLEAGERPAESWARAASALGVRGAPAIVVSDEVGQGVVPATVAGRRFRDELGRLNQLVASDAATVTVVVAGIPVAIKAVA